MLDRGKAQFPISDSVSLSFCFHLEVFLARVLRVAKTTQFCSLRFIMSFAPLHLPVHVLVGSSPYCACVGVTGRYTDRSSRTSLDLCGSASSLVFALRGKLPLRLRDAPEVVDGVSYRVQPPPDLREAELSTWSVHRSHPTVGCRRHGIVQHWQRKPTSVWRRTLTSFGFLAVSVSSLFYVVSLLRLLYAPVCVDLPLLPTFLDPP